jgi:uncharacterized protein (TIGR02611 family)
MAEPKGVLRSTSSSGKRILVAVAGSVVVVVGLALLVLPGPGIAVVIAGLAILATEFIWARRLLQRARAYARRTAQKVRGRGAADGGDWARPRSGGSDRAA